MITYDVIEILSGNVVLSDVAYEDCITWIENFGDIINYTIIIHYKIIKCQTQLNTQQQVIPYH